MPIAYNITPSQSNKDYNARASERSQAITSSGNRPSARGGDVIAFSAKDHGADASEMAQAVALYDDPRRFDARGIHGGGEHGELHPPLNTVNPQQIARIGSAVRRLTPRECERLQGFPDDYTLITHRKKPAADGPRYKALGNSMAVPVMSWIGQRIAMVEAAQEAAA